MKIEVGKFYRTRDGHKVGPIRNHAVSHNFPWIGDLDREYKGTKRSFVFKEDGSNYEFTDLDIVGEWNEMKIEAGKTYLTADGITVGPIQKYGWDGSSFIEFDGDGRIWDSYGVACGSDNRSGGLDNLVEEKIEFLSPVKEVTKKEILTGRFGPKKALEIDHVEEGKIRIRVLTAFFNKKEIGELVKTLAEIEGAM